MDPQDFGFLAPDPQKYAGPRIRIQGVKNQPKIVKKKTLILNPKSELLKEREIIQISSFLNGLSSFRIKISENLKEMTGSIFFSVRIQDPDPHQN